MSLGIAIFLYGCIAWIRECISRARMRKAMKYIQIGINTYWEGRHHAL